MSDYSDSVHDQAKSASVAQGPFCFFEGALCAHDVLVFIEERYASASLQDAAKHFYCHPNTISNLLVRAYGKNFSTILMEVRMKKSYELLTYTSLPVTNVALRCGYQNMTHFYRVFESYFGIKPGACRQQLAAV